MNVDNEPTTALYVDARGELFLAACAHAFALVAGNLTDADEGCCTIDCACTYEERELTAPFALASREQADAYWHAVAAGAEDPRY